MVCNFGYYDSIEPVKGNKYYLKWAAMIQRCYDTKHQIDCPTYIGVTICDDWRFYSKFKIWMESTDWQGKELDKDILVIGNKIYSPDTCCFVSKSLNNFFKPRMSNAGSLPQGVSKNKKRFSAKVRIDKKEFYFGTFDTIQQAEDAYLLGKLDALKYFISIETNDKVLKALNNRLNL